MNSQTNSFDELLDAVDHLPTDDQAALIEVVRQRLAERGRQRVADETKAARAEYAAGHCCEASVDDIMREIES